MERIEVGIGIIVFIMLIVRCIREVFSLRVRQIERDFLEVEKKMHIEGITLIITIVCILLMPISILENLLMILLIPGAISIVFLRIWSYIFGKMRIIEFPNTVKEKMKVVKFYNKLNNVGNIIYICILIIYVGLMLNIHYNSRELYKAIEFSTVSICAVILWILVWSFKKSLLPKNIDEILEKAFNLNKISENKFVKKESEQSNFVFSYNIKKRRMIHRYLREFGFKKYIIYSEVMINKNSFNSNKINEDFFYDLRKQYWFLNFTFSDFGEEIRIIITPLYDYYDTVSAKYVVAILLSMYELAEKIVNKINSENL